MKLLVIDFVGTPLEEYDNTLLVGLEAFDSISWELLCDRDLPSTPCTSNTTHHMSSAPRACPREVAETAHAVIVEKV